MQGINRHWHCPAETTPTREYRRSTKHNNAGNCGTKSGPGGKENGPDGEGSRSGPHLGVQVLTGLEHRDRLKNYFEGKSTESITCATPFD